MRILHVGPICGFGGSETVTVALAKYQREHGIEADVFFFSDAGGRVLFDDICKVWMQDKTPLAEVLLRENYDIVHLVAATVPRAQRHLKRAFFGGAVVITSHGWFSSDMGSEHVVAVSKFGADQIQDRCCAPVRVIYNGIDVEEFSPPQQREASTKPMVAWVARSADPQKDPGGLTAISTAGLIQDYQLVVVDGSSEQTRLSDWLPADTKFMRQLAWNEMPGLYRSVAASGGFLLSTALVEWCPMNILEAQACGCPIIAPAVGGIPEIVEQKRTGFLYERTGGLDTVREAIEWLRSDGNYETAAKEARNLITRTFTVERMCEEYAEVYADAIKRRTVSIPMRLARNVARVGIPGVKRLKSLAD